MSFASPTTTPPLGIGSTVWVFDKNRRVYSKDKSAPTSSHPIYREHFRPVKIVAETSRSWVLEHEPWDASTKVNKKTLEGIFPTLKDVEDTVFAHDNRQRLSTALSRTHDTKLIRAVANLVDESEKHPVTNYIPW